MTPTAAIVAPQVRCFSGRQDSFVQDGERWRRTTPEDEAHFHTGFDHETHEPSVGIYIERRPNGLLRIGFDIWKLSLNLRPAVIERVENRWRQEAASFSKSLLRSTSRRSHFSNSFARFEIAPERLEAWKAELEHVLSNSESYECVSRRPPSDELATESSKQL